VAAIALSISLAMWCAQQARSSCAASGAGGPKPIGKYAW
jgi:hypothetical protein